MLELEFEVADFVKLIGVGRGAGVEVFQFLGAAIDLPLQVFRFREGGLHFVPQAVTFEVDAVLGQIIHPTALWLGDAAGIGFDHASDAFHEGGLAGSVGSGE